MNFASDNQSGVSPRLLQALQDACAGSAPAYANDPWTTRATQALTDLFQQELQVFFVATGTAANCLALSALVKPWEAVFCHHQAHILTDETSAPELFTGGARLLPIKGTGGKVLAADLRDALDRLPVAPPHSVRPAAVSITQATENGQVYTPDEVAELAALAHARGLFLHMDGARFANAVAALGCTPAELASGAGVDVLSLGATKNGALCAEAVIFFNTALAQDVAQRRKRAGQLISKGRMLGAQFEAWLRDGHWLQLAGHANSMARHLAACLGQQRSIRLAWPVQANEVFVVMPRALLQHLQGAGAQCYDWYADSLPDDLDMARDEVPVRFVTSWSTAPEEIDALRRVLCNAA